MEMEHQSSTSILDLDMDVLARCTIGLTLRDVANLSMSCRHFNTSDSIWLSLYRRKWPQIGPLWSLQESSIREAYLSRHIATHQFKYADPLVRGVCIQGIPPEHMLFDKNDIILSRGSSIQSIDTDLANGEFKMLIILQGSSIQSIDLANGVSERGLHSARITCMRLFSLNETSLHRNQSERDDDVLITSSADHFVRLWWKGGSRCFKGHTGPVSTISDRVLGDDNGKIFATGGEDKSVRLWSINSTGKRGHHFPKATLHGHEKAVSLISVAGHKPSLLVSISTNGKVFVWDTNEASSSTRSRSRSVGRTSVPSAPVGMKCHESLVHVAAGSSVVSIDLRTMKNVSKLVLRESINSFEVLPSNFLFCTGGTSSAKLWDIRRISRAEPIIELGHKGPVNLLHMDPYKIITAGPYDPDVNVWAPDTGVQTNSFSCATSLGEGLLPFGYGCCRMAVDGCRIVTASNLIGVGNGIILTYRDFTTATCDVQSNRSEGSGTSSKFWRVQSDGESEESEYDLV